MPYPPIVLDRAANLPLYRQIEVALRRSILDGRIGSGRGLPGIRAYARHLGVGAVTVMTAYEQLTAEGYLEPRPGARHAGRAGPAGPPGRGAPPCRDERRAAPTLPAVWPTRAAAPVLRRHPLRAAVRLPDRLDPPRPVPVAALGAAAAARVARPRRPTRRSATTYRYPEGDPRLRAELAAYLGMSRAVRTTADQVVVTAGAQSAFATAARLWLADGRDARARGSRRPAPPADLRGLRRRRGPRPGRRPRAAGRPPAGRRRPPCWSPRRGSTRTAGTMPVARRMQLLALGRRATSAAIIEDDCDSELRYEGHPQPSLQGLDEARAGPLRRDVQRRCSTRGSGPATRSSPRRGREAVRRAPRGGVPGTRRPRAAGAGAVPRRGPLRAAPGPAPGALRRAPGRAARRARGGARDGRVSARPAAAGAHLVVRIEDVGLTATALATRARALGVAVEPLSFSRHHPAGDQDLLIHYGRLSPAEIRAGIRLLARAASRPRRATA